MPGESLPPASAQKALEIGENMPGTSGVGPQTAPAELTQTRVRQSRRARLAARLARIGRGILDLVDLVLKCWRCAMECADDEDDED